MKKHFDDSLKKLNGNITWNKERQQHSRKRFLYKLDQDRSSKFSSWIKRSSVPLLATILFIGIASIFLFSELGKQNVLGPEQNDPYTQYQTASENDDQQIFQISGLDWQRKKEEAAIKKSGFDLRLPQYSPVENTKTFNIDELPNGLSRLILVSYFNEDEEQIFKFSQKGFKQRNDNAQKNTINSIKKSANNSMNINGRKAYYREDFGIDLKMLTILTENYVFTLSSYNQTKEDLINIGKSIDFSGLK